MKLRNHEHVMLSAKVYLLISIISSLLINHKMTIQVPLSGLDLLASVTVVKVQSYGSSKISMTARSVIHIVASITPPKLFGLDGYFGREETPTYRLLGSLTGL